MEDRHDFARKIIQVGQAFTPGSPIDEKDLFAGRLPAVQRVIQILRQRGQHAVIFGERGVGKTSLAKVIRTFLEGPETIIAPHIDCATTDSFAAIWKRVFAQINVSRERFTAGFKRQDTTESYPLSDTLKGDMTPDKVQEILDRLAEKNFVFIILDEFDRIKNRDARRLIADTIKSMSDRGHPATLLLVGVGDAVSDLIAEHESVERNIIQIPLPRMSIPELNDIVLKALHRLQMEIEPDALERIGFLSRGFPYYTHKLGQFAATVALEAGSNRLNQDHVGKAIDRTVNDGQYTHLRTYVTATASPRKDNLFREVLLACALADTDELGFFTASDVRGPLTHIMKRSYDVPSFARHLKEFCETKRGHILEKTGDRYNVRFRFQNPMMQPFVVMKGFSDGFLKQD